MVYKEVENKDFKRVQKLIDTNDDGSKMCKLIKITGKGISGDLAHLLIGLLS